eukprot:14103524-Alexandrium_andersonii.AAC.1
MTAEMDDESNGKRAERPSPKPQANACQQLRSQNKRSEHACSTHGGVSGPAPSASRASRGAGP